MIKTVINVFSRPFGFLVTVQPSVAFHANAAIHRWYKHFLRLKPQPSPINPALSFPEDWEAQPYKPQPADTISPTVKNLPGFNDLKPDVQKLFSMEFKSKMEVLEEEMNRKMIELGYHPTDTSCGAKIVSMTVKLRYKKQMLQLHPRNKILFRATRALVHARWHELRRLRSTNLPEFERLCKSLDITGFEHINPYEFPTTDPVLKRKQETRDECYQTRLLKLANCKMAMAKAELSFYKRKEQELIRLLDQLTIIETSDGSPEASRERAKLRLEKMLSQVIEDRRAETLEPYYDDKLSWYAKEQVIREKYLAQQAEKEAKQLKKKR